MEDNKEIWRSLDEVPKFEFSNLGNIRKKINYTDGHHGYRYMKKAKAGNRKRLIVEDKDFKDGYRDDLAEVYFLKAFQSYDPKKRIIHLDGDLTNNSLANLTQITPKQLLKRTKEQKLLRNVGFKIIKCREDTHEELKVYTYYSDATRDILHEQGYADNDITKTLINRTLRRIRYAVIQKKVPTAYGYWWISRNE